MHQWMRRKRILAGVLAGLALLSWWFGVLSPLSWVTGSKDSHPRDKAGKKTAGGSAWSIFGGNGGAVNWDDRAESVKTAFKITWAGYEKYGWGMYKLIVRLPQRRELAVLMLTRIDRL